MLTINQELQKGRYQIIKQFGQGKTISFYEAMDKTLGKNVLLKRNLIPENETGNSLIRDHQNRVFETDCHFFSEIQHDGFLQTYDYFSEGEANYLVMELVDGKNFGELMRKGVDEFALADIVHWGEQILDALHYIHKKSPPIVYFNLRPPNIHLTAEGKIKLLATGIGSKPDENGRSVKFSFDTANLNYSPLELIWQKLDAGTQRVILNGYDEKSEMMLLLPPDERCDFYSLGTTLYQMMTRQLPKDALERSIEILEGRKDPLIAPHELNATVSREISDVVVKSLEISREKRFQSALEMRSELETAYKNLREQKAQLLRGEVPAAPATQTLHQKLLEKAIPKKQIEESVVTTEPSTLDSSANDEKNVNPARRIPEFGLDLDLLDLGDDRPVPIVPPSPPTIASDSTESENLVAEEQWQEEFDDEVDSNSNWNFEEHTEEPTNEESDEFKYLFGTPKSESKTLKRLAIAAFGVIVIGGGAFGVIKFLPAASAEAPQQTLVAPDSIRESQQTAEIQTESGAENNTQNPGTENSEFVEAPENPITAENNETPSESKAKNEPTQIAVVKQPERPKSAVPEKKKVTVDDLINDTPKRKVTVDDLISDN